MERKLASIQTVVEVNPIEGADRIEQITVLGWSLVAKKSEFKPGDLCVFLEIDAVLSETAPWAAFMKDRKFRVKTVKMRGCLSQGLALPLDILPPNFDMCVDVLKPGLDVTEVLGVRKYEPPETGGVNGYVYGAPMPLFVPRTDEVRLQSAPALLDEIKQYDFYWTVKLDGFSATYIRTDRQYALWKPGDLIVCNRKVATREDPNLEDPNNKGAFWPMARKYDLANRLPIGFAVQGEIMGPKVAGNKLELEEHDLFIFSVYNMAESRFLDLHEFLVFCRDHGLKAVPAGGLVFYFSEDANNNRKNVLAQELMDDFGFSRLIMLMGKTELDRAKALDVLAETDSTGRTFDVNWFLKTAQGNYTGTQNRREGIVVRPVCNVDSPTLAGLVNLTTESPRLTFKVLNNDYLLKDET
jgi:RNA ligase (TIGR02306 family)